MIYQKIGFIGFGSMSQSIIHRLLEKKVLKPSQVFVSNRSEKKIQKAKELGLQTVKNNEELIESVDVVFLAVKPQDLSELLESVENIFTEDQTVISLAAGVSHSKLKRSLTGVHKIVRIMPNTPIRIGQGVIGYSIASGAESVEPLVQGLLDPLGRAISVNEGEPFEALTVSCGSGTGFVFELMQYWQEWLESYDFSREEARDMTVQTFLGAALLADKDENTSIEELQKRVVSKKGVTHAGLESMRELEVERALRYSFEKAVLRDRELGKN